VAVVRLAVARALGQIALVVPACHVDPLHAHDSADGFSALRRRPQYHKSWFVERSIEIKDNLIRAYIKEGF